MYSYRSNDELYKDMQLYLLQKAFEETEKKIEEDEKTADMLLDEYNDNMILFQMFDDNEYKEKAKNVLNELQRIQ